MVCDDLRKLVKLRDREDFDNYWDSEGHKALFVVIYVVINVALFFGWLGGEFSPTEQGFELISIFSQRTWPTLDYRVSVLRFQSPRDSAWC
jgi:hypothetical protein